MNYDPEDEVLRPAETCRVTKLSNMQLMRLEAEGLFPRRFKLNPFAGQFGAAGHSKREVMAWIADRRASREVA